jgi:DDE superfamily endonuclease
VAEDEARLGLKPVIRRVWAPVGEKPTARFKMAFKWTYLYGFVHPESGDLFWIMLPTVNTELFSLALREFAREVGAGKERRILLVVDKAGWHAGGRDPRGDRPGVLAEGLSGAYAGGEIVAADQRGTSQQALRGDRRGRRGAGGTLCRTARSARSQKRSHQLPLVSQGAASGMRFRASFTRIRYVARSS